MQVTLPEKGFLDFPHRTSITSPTHTCVTETWLGFTREERPLDQEGLGPRDGRRPLGVGEGLGFSSVSASL